LGGCVCPRRPKGRRNKESSTLKIHPHTSTYKFSSPRLEFLSPLFRNRPTRQQPTLVIDKVINKLFHFAGEVTQFHQLVKVEEGNDGVLGIAGNVNYLENKNY
jgi:hypothetical protein